MSYRPPSSSSRRPRLCWAWRPGGRPGARGRGPTAALGCWTEVRARGCVLIVVLLQLRMRGCPARRRRSTPTWTPRSAAAAASRHHPQEPYYEALPQLQQRVSIHCTAKPSAGSPPSSAVPSRRSGQGPLVQTWVAHGGRASDGTPCVVVVAAPPNTRRKRKVSPLLPPPTRARPGQADVRRASGGGGGGAARGGGGHRRILRRRAIAGAPPSRGLTLSLRRRRCSFVAAHRGSTSRAAASGC
jgi:hypothetical protein